MSIKYPKNIERKNPLYFILKFFVDTASRQFYERYEIDGTENVPQNEIVIFSPNHQNALMDAMAVISSFRWRQILFLARADIFQKPLIARLLFFFKMLPIFRLRDGVDTSTANEKVFELCVKLLKNYSPLTLYPEGTHNGKRHLQQLKKGLARIAFQTAEFINFKQDIIIIPTGITYADYHAYRSKILIKFGVGISVKKYYDLYKKHPNQAYLALSNELSEKMMDEIVHIEDMDNYNFYDSIREIYRYTQQKDLLLDSKKMVNLLIADQVTIQDFEKMHKKTPDLFHEIVNETTEFTTLAEKKKLPITSFKKGMPSAFSISVKTILLLIFSPIFLIGKTLTIIPDLIMKKILTKIQDIFFHSSIKFAVGSFIVYPLFFTIYFGISFLFFNNLWQNIAVLFASPFIGLAAFYYNRFFGKFRKEFYIFRNKKHSEIQKLNNLYNSIISKTRKWILE